MLSLEKSHSFSKHKRQGAVVVTDKALPPLSLAKVPRAPHPKVLAVVQLLARQAARQEFTRQFPARSDQGINRRAR